MPVRGPMLLHRMVLVSFRLFCKNLGNLQEFFGQMVYHPPWPKIARTPMLKVLHFLPGLLLSHFKGLFIPIWREITGRKFYQN